MQKPGFFKKPGFYSLTEVIKNYVIPHLLMGNNNKPQRFSTY